MRPVLTDADQAEILRCDPWSGDTDADARTFRDAFVRTRVPAWCAICMSAIAPGSLARSQTQQSDEMRKVMTFKFCEECCRAMLVACEFPEMLEVRYEIGRVVVADRFVVVS